MSLQTRLNAVEREARARPPDPPRCPTCGGPDPTCSVFVIDKEPGTCPDCQGPVDADTGRTLRGLLLGEERWTRVVRICHEPIAAKDLPPPLPSE